jgi:hypothetical protein
MQYESLSARLAANSKPVRLSRPIHDPATGKTLRCSCRVWTGNLNNSGYPRFSKRVGGQVVKEYAHRAAFELATGKPIPAGLTLDHLCVRESCIEPAHLEAVTQDENTRRRTVRIRAEKRAA